jgi:hypothetical protein
MTTAHAIADIHLIYRVAGAAKVSPTTVRKVLSGARPSRVRGPLLRVLAALASEGVDTPERLADAASAPTAASLRAV